MLLLVLLAAFFFVFQGQMNLRDNLADSTLENETLRQEQAQLEIEHSALQATSTAAQSVQTTTEAEREELRTELVATDRMVATLEAQADAIVQERDSAKATMAAYETVGPLVEIVNPQASTVATVGEDLTLVIVAGDLVGVRSVNISIGDRLLDSEVVPGQVVTVRESWTPTAAGQAIITVSAVNENGVTSHPEVVTVVVQEAPATSTPVPSPTSPPTVAPTPQP